MGTRHGVTASGFTYSNHPDGPPGRLARWGSRVSRGVRQVQAQVPAYAVAWEAHNRRVLVRSDSGSGSDFRSESHHRAAGGPLWFVLGDSMAQGIGASAWDRGWPGQLADRVPGLAALRLVNLSAYGAGVLDVIERQWPAAVGLATSTPPLVTVVIGSNDLFDRRRRRVLPVTAAGLFDLLPSGALVATLPQPRAAARAFNDRLLQAAGVRDLVVADAASGVDWRGRLSPDHFHPNDRGYAAMADALAPAAREALVRRG